MWGSQLNFPQTDGVQPGAETFKVTATGQYTSQMVSRSTSQRICPMLEQAQVAAMCAEVYPCRRRT